MSSSLLVLDEVPGMDEAVRALQLVGGVLLDTRQAQQLAVAAWLAAEPAARAAAFADAADLFYEWADAWKSAEYYNAAVMLDMMSHEMRSPQ